MASSLWKLSNLNNLNLNISAHLCGSIRKGHHLRGKPPGIARSLEQRLAEENAKDPKLHYRVDIGLPPQQVNRLKQLQERLKIIKNQRSNKELEKLARNHKLLINLDEVKEEWKKTGAPNHIKTIADHYGVFEHLFGDAYFYPRVPLSIYYNCGDLIHPVYFGNVLKPIETKERPQVKFESDEKTLWTLIMTNPDGHFTEQDKEYVHWFVGNIPGNQLDKGEVIYEYLQPFPPKGTGYHRHIFILYQQTKKLDFSNLKKQGSCLNLNDRTFSTYEFYKEKQDYLTPAGLSFFQSDWDSSLKEFFHHKLDMKEPIYEYDFEPPYIRKQEWFPKGKPFNLYLDKYRDPKQINKEFLVRKLKDVHPFKEPAPPLPYPNAQIFEEYKPTWLKLEIRKSRMKWGRINEIEQS